MQVSGGGKQGIDARILWLWHRIGIDSHHPAIRIDHHAHIPHPAGGQKGLSGKDHRRILWRNDPAGVLMPPKTGPRTRFGLTIPRGAAHHFIIV